VAGLNMIKKATKPNPQTGEGGGIIEKEASIHASNVMILDPKTGKGTRKRPQ
jgi:large subunit ribosomal protein L24